MTTHEAVVTYHSLGQGYFVFVSEHEQTDLNRPNVRFPQQCFHRLLQLWLTSPAQPAGRAEQPGHWRKPSFNSLGFTQLVAADGIGGISKGHHQLFPLVFSTHVPSPRETIDRLLQCNDLIQPHAAQTGVQIRKAADSRVIHQLRFDTALNRALIAGHEGRSVLFCD